MASYRPSDKWIVRLGGASLLVDKRVSAVFAALLALTLFSLLISMSVGASALSWAEMWAAATGRGEAMTDLILFEIRLPRMIACLVAGFALGLAGCIAQTIFRNRLASPDILGINEGATLAIVSYVLYMTTASWPFWIAPIGSLIAVVLLYKLCTGPAESGALLLVIGVCLTEFLRSIVEFMMSMGALHEVQSIYIWMHGSFIGQAYQTSMPVLAVLVLSFPVQFYLARKLEILRLSPAVASSLGVNVPALQLVGIITVAVLAALGAAIGGPVVFIAMAAPILVATLVKDRTPALWCSGLLGAGILQISDTLARTVASPHEIATGVVTKILGGIFLLYLLLKDGKR